MSKYGHYATQYYRSKNNFPIESFCIAGISNYQDKLSDVNCDTILHMKQEPTNKYDPNAITVCHNDVVIGYVPKEKLCDVKENINESLCILNIGSTNGLKSIRVVPQKFFKPEQVFHKYF